MATGPATFSVQMASRDLSPSAAVKTSKAQASPFYRPELDALRFFAFFAVFIAHGTDINERSGALHNHPSLMRAIIFLHHAGGFGLSLFFFLSSYLITTLLMLEQKRTGTVHLRNFYVRRMLRIWPLYLLYMSAAFALGHFWAPAAFSGHALLAYFTLSANWYVIAAGTLTPAVMFLWSISVEEQFYLVWPTVVRSLGTRGIRNFCLSLVVASLAGIYLLAATHSTVLNIWFSSITETLFFAAGGLLAIHLGLRQQTKSWLRCAAGILLCIACWMVSDATGNFNDSAGTITPSHALATYVLIAVGTASLLWAFLHMPRQLIRPELVYLGRISYGLYVFHGMSLLIGRHFIASHMHGGTWLVATFALTVCLAAASYEYLEKPFLKLKHRFEIVQSRAA